MAKKRTPVEGDKMPATAKPQRSRAKSVRLDLSDREHERLQEAADRLGLSMASCARMAVLSWLQDQEKGPPKR